MKPFSTEVDYQCWLNYIKVDKEPLLREYQEWCRYVTFSQESVILKSAREELVYGLDKIIDKNPAVSKHQSREKYILISSQKVEEDVDVLFQQDVKELDIEGYIIKAIEKGASKYVAIASRSDKGILYGVYHFLRILQGQKEITNLDIVENPVNPLRIINHWDNLDGSIERGYAGKSIFYKDHQLTENLDRVRDYARLLASVGINSVVVNNVNVDEEETRLITDKLDIPKTLADIFRRYGIRLFLSVNFASPVTLGDLDTADPLDDRVRDWWKKAVEKIYQEIPDFGGFLVKADSEFRPGPFTYNRNHAEGANMLASALKPFGGVLIWRAFVYNCKQDWRDRSTDRARAAYDNFKPLDGDFDDNVIIQIKNGPMDFQVREPVHPLFGGMEKTNQMLELQITQEYTGQQRHLCYLVPQWKEVLEFETYARGKGSPVKRIVDGSLFEMTHAGFAGVVNVGDDLNWTGHTLAQANLFGYGRLAWNPDLSAKDITDEWIKCTFGNDQEVIEVVANMLLKSWRIYENYNAPLGIGWMVNPGHHYGPNVDGYEYSHWGTYHRADCHGIGIDRSVKTGTGYAGLYYAENAAKYESIDTCPDELLLFFHRVPYTHKLKSGKTVIQHIYDTHFEGVEQAKGLVKSWESIKDKIDNKRYNQVLSSLKEQMEHAKEWRDVINTYFYRKTGIDDEKGRKIYR